MFGRGDQSDLVAQLRDLPAPMLGLAASLHRDGAGRESGEKLGHPITPTLPSKNRAS